MTQADTLRYVEVTWPERYKTTGEGIIGRAQHEAANFPSSPAPPDDLVGCLAWLTAHNILKGRILG